MSKVTKALTKLRNGVTYTISLAVSISYMFYYTLFLPVNKASTAGALQLQDSDAAYALGKGMATSSVPSWIMVAMVILFVYTLYNMIFNTNETEK